MKKAMALCFLAASIPLLAAGRQEYAFLSYPLEKVRPLDMPAPAAGAAVRLAGNEYEHALIGVCNPGPKPLSLAAVRIERPCGSVLSLAVSRIGYIPVATSSRWFAPAQGLWPDPVIPLRAVQGVSSDPELQQTVWLLQKPIEVPAGENRIFLLEIYLPMGSRVEEDLAVRFDSSDARPLSLEVHVRSWDFDLPRESSMASAFIFSGNSADAKHAALSKKSFDVGALRLEYLHLLSRFRISVMQPVETGPAAVDAAGVLSFDWREFDGIAGGILDGTLFPDAPPATSIGVPPAPAGLSPGNEALFLRETAAHMRGKGWLSRMYAYLPDEPLRSEYPMVRETATRIRSADPGIRRLATEPYSPELEGSVDIWCLDIPYIGDTLPWMPIAARWPYQIHFDSQRNPFPSLYGERRAAGEDVWIYTCNSSVFLDYPNLFIDSAAGYSRIIPWLAFRWGFSGLLYWHADYSYCIEGDPWKDQYIMMANGDGNLLYPGIPEIPDIDVHKPIPSLRLYLLRDGFEDFEYLALLSRRAGETEARRLSRSAANTALEWMHETREIGRVRDIAAARIEAPSP